MTERTNEAASPLDSWSMDREVVLSRVINAPREQVFTAWTDARHLAKWFGPAGFTITSHVADIREGGEWRFDMIGPDGTRYTNRMRFLEIDPPSLIIYDHGSDIDDDPGKFRVTLTFDQQSNGKTVITLRQLHPSVERRSMVIGFGAVEYGYQTLAKLADHAETMAAET